MSAVTLCDQVACDPRRFVPNRPQIIQPLDVQIARAVTPGGGEGRPSLGVLARSAPSAPLRFGLSGEWSNLGLAGKRLWGFPAGLGNERVARLSLPVNVPFRAWGWARRSRRVAGRGGYEVPAWLAFQSCRHRRRQRQRHRHQRPRESPAAGSRTGSRPRRSRNSPPSTGPRGGRPRRRSACWRRRGCSPAAQGLGYYVTGPEPK
jgi:hypothetical protein